MPQTKLLLLAHGHDVDHLRNLAHFGQLVQLSCTFQHTFQLQIVVEVILDDVLVPVGHKDHVLNIGPLGLFHHVLDDGFIVDGQHFLGDILCCGQRTCSPSGHGNDDFPNFLHAFLPPCGV